MRLQIRILYVRTNAHNIALYKEIEAGDTNSCVIENYFINTYQVQENYILLSCIVTKGDNITVEERNNPVLNYYLVNTEADEVFGGYDSYEEFGEQSL